jgi:hypothetical protein
MTQKLSGGCACGAIHYDCNADPVAMFNCHCRDCQRASGSAYAAIVSFRKLRCRCVESRGITKSLAAPAKRSNAVFCPTCGSHVTDKLERLPNILALQAGSLDDPSMYRPMMDVFTSSAQPWDHMDPKLQTRKARRGDVPPYPSIATFLEGPAD